MENLIKVGYDSKTNLYTFKVPGGYDVKNVCVNGQPITDPLRGQKVGELMTIAEKPETITYETTKRSLVGYLNSETDETITVQKYQEWVNQIDETRDYNEYDDSYEYETLEGEVFATRFFRTHSAVHETVTTLHNMDIEFINYPVSEYSNIVPLYSIDAKNVFETKCKFTPNVLQLFKDICKARGIEDSRIDIPNHSGLRFVKIDGNFISGMEQFQNTAGREIIATYEECVARMNSIKNELTELINFHFAKRSQNVLDKTTVGNLLIELSALRNSVNALDVKVKDESSQRSVSKRISDLIDIYKELA